MALALDTAGTRTLAAASVHDLAGFQSRLDAFVHRRLKLVTLVLPVISAVIVVGLVVLDDEELGLPPELTRRTIGTLVIYLAVILWMHLLLRRLSPTTRRLELADVGVTVFTLAVFAAIYAFDYRTGPVLVPPLIGMLLILRAVVVPSRELRTVVLSLPAPLIVLAIQLGHGQAYYAHDRPPVVGLEFEFRVVWTQVFLLLAVGISVLASRLSFRLRLEADRVARLGNYQLEEKIGEGGMGTVYKASHALLRRPTAVKVIRLEHMHEKSIKRFEKEVMLTARLTHPNTVEVFDFGRTETGVFYYAMEYLTGADLRHIVAETGPMPASRVIHLLAQALAALSEAHHEGLVHRDIKASNLFLCTRGEEHDFIKVMDFGLVKDLRSEGSAITVTGEVLGTPDTISPEAIQGKEVGPRADLYAIGSVGSFLLTGRHAFTANTTAELYSCHLYNEPVPPSQRNPDVPADLEALLLRCLEKDPADRPASAAALRNDLLACEQAGLWTEEDAARWWREYETGESEPGVSDSAETIDD